MKLLFFMILLLVFFSELGTSSVVIQNNTFCNVVTEKTKHTFKQEIFCDYARNSSNVTNVTIEVRPRSYSGGGGGGLFIFEPSITNTSDVKNAYIKPNNPFLFYLSEGAVAFVVVLVAFVVVLVAFIVSGGGKK